MTSARRGSAPGALVAPATRPNRSRPRSAVAWARERILTGQVPQPPELMPDDFGQAWLGTWRAGGTSNETESLKAEIGRGLGPRAYSDGPGAPAARADAG